MESGEVLGCNIHRGRRREVCVGPDLSNRHMYIVGTSGTGKSTLFQRLVHQHLLRDEGVGVIDPHGSLIERLILPIIPASRVLDVVYFDAADLEHPMAFNVLDNDGSEIEREHIRGDLLSIFEEIMEAKLGVNIAHILNFSLITLLRRRGSTLADVLRILTDDAFRAEAVRQIRDPQVLAFWRHEFPQLRKAVTPIANKLSPLLLSPIIGRMLTSAENRID